MFQSPEDQEARRRGWQVLGGMIALDQYQKWQAYQRYSWQLQRLGRPVPPFTVWKDQQRAMVASMPHRSPRAAWGGLIAASICGLLTYLLPGAGFFTLWGLVISLIVLLWGARKVPASKLHRRS